MRMRFPSFPPVGTHYSVDRASVNVFFNKSTDVRKRSCPYLSWYLAFIRSWLCLVQGVTWHPVNPVRPVVYKGGVSEVGWAFTADGGIQGVMRNEGMLYVRM